MPEPVAGRCAREGRFGVPRHGPRLRCTPCFGFVVVTSGGTAGLLLGRNLGRNLDRLVDRLLDALPDGLLDALPDELLDALLDALVDGLPHGLHDRLLADETWSSARTVVGVPRSRLGRPLIGWRVGPAGRRRPRGPVGVRGPLADGDVCGLLGVRGRRIALLTLPGRQLVVRHGVRP
jgi:hypothetical protein